MTNSGGAYVLHTKVTYRNGSASDVSEQDGPGSTITIPIPPPTGKTGSSPMRMLDPEVKRAVECPSCREVALPPILTCTTGHLICSICRPKVNRCSICSSSFTPVPNFTVESLVSMLELRCRYAGCPQVFRANELLYHLPLCYFRPIKCNETRQQECDGNLIPFHNYVDHLKDRHGSVMLEIILTGDPALKKCCYKFRDLTLDRTWAPLILIFDEQKFLIKLELKNGNMFCKAAFIGSEAEAQKYFIMASTQSRNVIPRVELILPIHSVRTEESKIPKGDIGCIAGHTIMSSSKKVTTGTNESEFTWHLYFGIEKRSEAF